MARFVDDLAVTTAPPVPAHWRSARKSPIPNLIVLGSLLLSLQLCMVAIDERG